MFNFFKKSLPAGVSIVNGRLVSTRLLTKQDFGAIAKHLGVKPVRARKIGFVAARKAEVEESVTTLYNGKESQKTAQLGDWIVTNLKPDGNFVRDKDGNVNTYVISADSFPKLYKLKEAEKEGQASYGYGAVYEAISEVDAIRFAGGLELIASFGPQTIGDAAMLQFNRSNEQVFGNAEGSFRDTFVIL